MTSDVMTADDLLQWYCPGKRAELVRGRLVVSEPAGARHGATANRVAYLLTAHAEANDRGRVYAAETGFWIATDPDTVRAPDVAFVSRERLPEEDPEGYARIVPDLVVEVMSPSDRAGEVDDKVRDWLAAAVRLVWVVNPRSQTVRVFRENGSESTVGLGEFLDAEPVLPGFLCLVADVFGR